jgi:hypothetical protein
MVQHQPPVPRHPINGGKDLSATGIGKDRDDIVEEAWTVFLQLLNNRPFKG